MTGKTSLQTSFLYIRNGKLDTKWRSRKTKSRKEKSRTTMVDKIPWDICVITLIFGVFKTEFLKSTVIHLKVRWFFLNFSPHEVKLGILFYLRMARAIFEGTSMVNAKGSNRHF